MADASRPAPDSGSSSADWYAQQWARLCDELGITDPTEVVPRVRTLKQQMDRLDEQERPPDHLVTVGDVERVLQEMHEKIEALRERNAMLAGQHGEDAADPEALQERERTIEALLSALDAPTPAEALERVEQLGERLESLYREKATFAEAGLSDPETVAEEFSQLRAERDRLRDERDALQDERDRLATAQEASLPPEATDALGIDTATEAQAVADILGGLHDQLGTEAPADADLLTHLRAIATHLRDRRSGADVVSDAVRDLLDVDAAADVRALAERIMDQAGRLARLAEPTEAPDAPDPTSVDEALATMERTADQLADLRDAYEQRADAAERLAAINDVLGIRSGEEAEELSALARDMERQLETLYAEKEKLRDLGLGSIEDVVNMVESMETQLNELYEDKEALQEAPSGAPDQQSTFQQLEALYAEQEKLQQALGVSSADDVIEMVETLTSQLDDLYEQVDAASQADGDASLPTAASSPVSSSLSATGRADADKDVALASMARQLEALYREKKVLLERGLHSAQAAASRLKAQRTEIETLQRENQTHAQRLDRLATELGTTDADILVDLVRALEDEAGKSAEALLESSAPPSPDAPPTDPLLDSETLDRLDDMPPADLDALGVGVVCLSDDGTVEFLNEAAHQLSELPDPDSVPGVVGANFFTDLAPSTANALFYGRFRAGQRREAMDTRFTYTFARPGADDRTFAVHLYRAPGHDANWVLFRPV